MENPKHATKLILLNSLLPLYLCSMVPTDEYDLFPWAYVISH